MFMGCVSVYVFKGVKLCACFGKWLSCELGISRNGMFWCIVFVDLLAL